MKITAVNDAGSLFVIQVNDGNISSLRNGLAQIMGIPASDQMLLCNGHEVKSLDSISENDLILVRQKPNTQVPLSRNIGYPGLLDQDAYLDVQVQKRIEEEIKRNNIAENLSNAMEYNPESFGRVIMLYIPVQVNGVAIKAFVDSGAQATIISPSLALKCGIMHLLDERFAGIARGVGTAKILGRIHSAPIKIGSVFLPCSFTVMENKGVQFLLGLDMLKRHQAIIDLSLNALKIGEVKVEFLPEHEIPVSDIFDENTAATTSNLGSNEPPARTSVPQRATASHQAYPESSIRTLMGLGVSRQEAIQALDACGGNADMAASMLFN